MSLGMLKSSLKSIGYENIHCFRNSVEAWESFCLEQLSDEPFDLVMTDLNMPGLDGMDFVTQIKSDKLCKDTKIIVVSADADPLIIDEAMNKGVEEYIVKPIDLNLLKEKLESIFKN